MRITSTTLMFGGSALLALVAAWLAAAWLEPAAATGASQGNERRAVVVAAVEIPFGEQIKNTQLKVIAWPRELVPEGAVAKIEEATGKIATRALFPGDIVTTQRIAEHAGGSHLSALIGENKRAVSVRVDDVVGVAGFLLPGNRVDVLGVIRIPNTNRVDAYTVLENVIVLAVDQDITPEENKPKLVRAVTLELTPQQAERLVKAANEGKIQLSLRNPLERQAAKVTPRPAPKKIVRHATATKPAVPQKRVASSVTVIRGTEVSEVRPES